MIKKLILFFCFITLVSSLYFCLKECKLEVFDFKNEKVIFNKSKNKIIVYFSVGCATCKEELLYFKENSVKYKNSDVYFITNEKNRNNINFYLNRNQLNALFPYIYYDKGFSITKYFNLSFEVAFPTIITFKKGSSDSKIYTSLKEISD